MNIIFKQQKLNSSLLTLISVAPSKKINHHQPFTSVSPPRMPCSQENLLIILDVYEINTLTSLFPSLWKQLR